MSTLYNTHYTRRQLLERAGQMAQFGGVRLSELVDGPERGVRVADFSTGSGLSFTVHVDRGLDIGAATFEGVPLAFRTNAPLLHPAHYEEPGLGWLRGFAGGLLTTCGLTYFGAPGEDAGE